MQASVTKILRVSASNQKNSMDSATVIVAAIAASAIGALFYNVLPLYIGSAQDSRGLDNRASGLLSSAFFLGFNVVTISAFFWIRRIRWSLVAATAAPVAALSLIWGTFLDSYAGLLVTALVAGGAFSAIYGVGTTVIGDTSRPSRWYGVKIALEGLSGALLLLVLPSTAIALWGHDGVAFGIVIALVVLCPALFWIPKCGVKGPGPDMLPIDVPEPAAADQTVQVCRIGSAIAAALIFFTGASALWAFAERIGVHGGHDSAAIGRLLAASLFTAVIGSVLAALLGGRFRNSQLFLVGGIAFVFALVLLGEPRAILAYSVGICTATFAIGFLLPIAITQIAELDTDGRYVVLSVPAIGVGAMAGPGIGGILTYTGSFTPMLVFCAVAMITATALLSFAASWASSNVEATHLRPET